ncbi:hypothetical protein IR152_18865 [Clostridioides sp. ES-S-0108-01]|uniref:hypothetical protein n=1 Tax=unclassified Clostridioides TaxID=2635829 RepID=UPI001D0C6267|nr:hypothetical protein [Clostridioides sp. ES-S-0107-01]MCC0785062.1 hypothetical protein [Clostridioides sp. ES-S-0108-01]UDN53013.1 hypothetical protein JJC16_18270 [Clostridioides sp. ES-S-0107-01]
MKKFSKLFIYLSLMFSLILLITGKSYASDSSNEIIHKVKVTITNDQTGEITTLNPIAYNNKSTNTGCEVFIPIGELITPFESTGGTHTSGGVTAKLNVDYDVNSTNEKVRLNRVYGSWTPNSSLYTLSNRSVNAHSGVITGKKLTKSPTSNTFSYTTGWGYNDRAWGNNAPRAWSSAKIHVQGMTATHTINVEFTYS